MSLYLLGKNFVKIYIKSKIFCVKYFKNYNPVTVTKADIDTSTHLIENITYPHMQVKQVIIDNLVLQ